MSDYHHRLSMDGGPCPQCDEGTVTGDHNGVKCDNPDCSFRY